eukprot:m.59823 g.59823  ORF g.59823 m.59823 type:complete len:95 (+) comp12257_c1_seq1:91-375(+)
MAFTLGSLLEAILLCINAIAVLQDFSPSLQPNGKPVPRFLAKMGWAKNEQDSFTTDSTSVKSKMIHFTSAVRTLLRVPLIAINAVTIVYLILLG